MDQYFDPKIRLTNLQDLANRTVAVRNYVELGGHTEIVLAVDVRTGEMFALDAFKNFDGGKGTRSSDD